jgi:ribosomal protein S18 acetylase RimI-like enzyme
MEIIIKPAYDQIETIRVLFAEYTQMLGVNLDFQNYAEELEQLPGKYGLPDGRLYIAFADSKAVGCVGMRRINDTSCEMKRLYVKTEFRGHKIGQMLANKIIEDAVELKYDYMLLDTFATLKKAVSLYKKLGFYEIEPYYNNPLENVIYMRLYL